ncbi:MAG TPA: cyanophycinase [Telluria sp.]|jgi:cyanophycinase
MNSSKGMGSLLVIGGSEDRTENKEVLQRFMALAGGADAPIVVLTAASKVPHDVWEMYETAFADLGARQVQHVVTLERADAEKRDVAELVKGAKGVLMTGGDQKRLMAILGGSAIETAMRHAFTNNGACIAGTSAGASALCAHMVAEGKAELAPEKDAVRLGKGMGFVNGVIVDQHFSQRHRINRLLSTITQHPFLMGAGIDENTALIVQPKVGIEVIGEGCVSVLDSRRATSNINEIPSGSTPQIFGVRLHLLPSGSAFGLNESAPTGSLLSPQLKQAPREITDFVNELVNGTE